jgi:hypothetical protein
MGFTPYLVGVCEHCQRWLRRENAPDDPAGKRVQNDK